MSLLSRGIWNFRFHCS